MAAGGNRGLFVRVKTIVKKHSFVEIQLLRVRGLARIFLSWTERQSFDSLRLSLIAQRGKRMIKSIHHIHFAALFQRAGSQAGAFRELNTVAVVWKLYRIKRVLLQIGASTSLAYT